MYTSKRLRLKDAVMSFTNETTLHGASLFFKAKSLPLKVLWGLIFLLSVLGLGIHLSTLIVRYTNHPINVDTKYTSEKIPFPDITICNTVALSLGKILYNWSDFTAVNAFNERLEHFANVKSLRAASNQTLYDIHRRVENMLYVSLSDKFGHGDYIIAQCLYREGLCDRNLIKEVKIPGYGNCFTLPSPGDVEESGEHGGYRMVIFTEGKQPNETWHGSYNDRFSILSNFEYNMPKPLGLKVIVHDKDSYPDPAFGVILSSGSYWNMAVEPTWTTRDPFTINGCTDQEKTKIQYRDYVKGDSHNYTYTLKDCRKIDIQNYWYETCGCLSEDYPIPAKMDVDTRPPNDSYRFDNFCFFSFEHMNDFNDWYEFTGSPNASKKDKHFGCAIEKLLKLGIKRIAKDECTSPCEERGFSVSLSQGKFGRDMPATHFYLHSHLYCEPPDWLKENPEYQSMIPTFEALCTGYHQQNYPLTELQLLRENFLQVHIYFQYGSIVKHIIESPAYPLTNLLSDIGGILGLYVGVSVLTICEILQFGIRLAMLVTGKEEVPGKNTAGIVTRANTASTDLCSLEAQENLTVLKEVKLDIQE